MCGRVALAILAITLITGGVGCGDEEEPVNADRLEASESSEKAKFIKQAEAICVAGLQQASGEIQAFIRKRGGTSSSQDNEAGYRAEAVQQVLLPSLERQIEKIRELPVPAGDESQVSAFLGALENAVAQTRSAPPSAIDNNKAGVELRTIFNRVDKLGDAFGFNACAYGGLR